MNPSSLQPVRSGNRLFSHAAFERLILALVLTGSFWAIWWSFTRLRSLQLQSRQLNQQVSRLTADIDLMRAQWSGSRTQEVSRRFEQLRDHLFLGELSVTDWSESLTHEAVPLALDARIQLGGPRLETNGAAVVTRLHASVDLFPSTVATPNRPLYHRIVDWSRHLALNPRRVDLVGLTLTGGYTNSGSASLQLELWADEKTASRHPGSDTPMALFEPSTPAMP